MKRVKVINSDGYTKFAGNLLASNITVSKLDSPLLFFAIIEVDKEYVFWHIKNPSSSYALVYQHQVIEI